MRSEKDRTIIKVEASAFNKTNGDRVEKGELLGYFDGNPVEAPFNGSVEGVSFDSENHALIVVLIKRT